MIDKSKYCKTVKRDFAPHLSLPVNNHICKVQSKQKKKKKQLTSIISCPTCSALLSKRPQITYNRRVSKMRAETSKKFPDNSADKRVFPQRKLKFEKILSRLFLFLVTFHSSSLTSVLMKIYPYLRINISTSTSASNGLRHGVDFFKESICEPSVSFELACSCP